MEDLCFLVLRTSLRPNLWRLETFGGSNDYDVVTIDGRGTDAKIGEGTGSKSRENTGGSDGSGTTRDSWLGNGRVCCLGHRAPMVVVVELVVQG